VVVLSLRGNTVMSVQPPTTGTTPSSANPARLIRVATRRSSASRVSRLTSKVACANAAFDQDASSKQNHQ
jgi:hypothetical protein